MCAGAIAVIAGAIAADSSAMPRADALRIQRVAVRCSISGDVAAADEARLCGRVALAGRQGGRPVTRLAPNARPSSTDLLLALDGVVRREAGHRILAGTLRTAQLRSGEDAEPAPLPLSLDIDDHAASSTIDAAVRRALRPAPQSASVRVPPVTPPRTLHRED
jgi:hypothetical protein